MGGGDGLLVGEFEGKNPLERARYILKPGRGGVRE
jgi:hypothetical protein